MNRKGISTILGTLVMIAILLGIGIFVYTQWQQLQVTERISAEVFYGTISVTISEDNYLDRGASVSTTSDSYIAYHTNDKSLDETVEDDFIGGASFTVGTAKDIAIDPDDNDE